jgi:hypothetical protein
MKSLADVLQSLLDEITSARPALTADIPFEPAEHIVVAPASNEHRQLIALIVDTNRELGGVLNRMADVMTANFMPTAEEHARKHELNAKLTLLIALTEYSLREQHDLYDACQVGLAQRGDDIVVLRGNKNELEQLMTDLGPTVFNPAPGEVIH